MLNPVAHPVDKIGRCLYYQSDVKSRIIFMAQGSYLPFLDGASVIINTLSLYFDKTDMGGRGGGRLPRLANFPVFCIQHFLQPSRNMGYIPVNIEIYNHSVISVL